MTLVIASGLLPLSKAFTFRFVTAIVSRVVSSAGRGLCHGVEQTFGGIMRVACTFNFGLAFHTISQPRPLRISTAAALFTLFLARDREEYAPQVAKAWRRSAFQVVSLPSRPPSFQPPNMTPAAERATRLARLLANSAGTRRCSST